MAVRLKFDAEHNVQAPTLVLCTRNGTQIGELPACEIVYTPAMNAKSDIQLRVYEYVNGVKYPYWNSVQDFKLVLAKEWNEFFEISVELNESTGRYKQITCTSLGEAETSAIRLYGIEINTEDDISRKDYERTIFYNEDKPEASLLHRIKEKAPHYIIKHVDTSLKGIQRVFSFDDVSLYDALRQISEEIDCIFILNASLDSTGNMVRAISAYDLESYCLACGTRGNFLDKCSHCGSTDIVTGYGDDTSVYVSVENLADNIIYSTDIDSVANCFKLEAGDDLMTATITNLNPNGSGYIWYISDEVKADMSPELVDKIGTYDSAYDYYNNDYTTSFSDSDSVSITSDGAILPASILNSYNQLVLKYGDIASEIDINLNTIPDTIKGYPDLMLYYYDTIDFQLFLKDGMMPSVSLLSETTAEKEVKKLTSQHLSPVAEQKHSTSVNVANNAVLSMAKVFIDPRYQVKITSSTLDEELLTDSNGVVYYQWIGSFSVTNYSDDEDTAVVENVKVKITAEYAEYIKQRMKKVMTATKPDDDATDIITLFELPSTESDNSATKTFEDEIAKYCLTSLNMFHAACQACLDVLIEQGVADQNNELSLYDTMYAPYREKLRKIENEIKKRESETAIVVGAYDSEQMLIEDGMQTLISKVRSFIQTELNFEHYLGEKLWLEFSAYRREDTYSNDNYISDGLDNVELFSNATEFLNVAKKEIYKSATRQHSISGTLKNLLVMKEFDPIVNSFELGNWIRVSADNNVYRLRLIGYSINFNDVSKLEVTFSDVQNIVDGYSDSKSVIDQMKSIMLSYDSVARQAGQAQKSKDFLDNWVENGLQLTQTKIVDSADNQNITIDKNGLWCKQYSDITDDYDDCELRLLSSGLYLTNDSWRTVKTGIGKFIYYDPESETYNEDYGLIAHKIVGNIILSEDVGIYNTLGSIKMDENGFVITADSNLPNDSNLFTIQKKSENSVLPILTVSKNGQSKLVADGDGSLVVNTSNFTLDANGNATFKGNIKSGSTITGATISGTTVNSGTINGTTITGASGDFAGDVHAKNLYVDDVIHMCSRDLTRPTIYYEGEFIQGTNYISLNIGVAGETVWLGDAYLTSELNINLDTTIKGTLTVSDMSVFNADMMVNSQAVFNNPVVFNGPVYGDTYSDSDRRLKIDKGMFDDNEALTILRELPIVNFRYKKDANNANSNLCGIYAQDLRDILNEHGFENKGYIFSRPNDTNDPNVRSDRPFDMSLPEEDYTYSINYSRFTMLLWKGWQNHDEQISQMSKEIKALQEQLKRVNDAISVITDR